MADHPPYVIEPMRLSDLDQVLRIEQVSFATPWSRRAYSYEISDNEHSTMLVLRPAASNRGKLAQLLSHFNLSRLGPVLGYGGYWLLVDEAHVSTLAVDPKWRGRGLGELLLLALLEQGARQDAQRATLEVRVSNLAAQGLYHTLGFEIASRRKRYYADNNEDAFIMGTPPFETPEFQENLQARRLQLDARLRKDTLDWKTS